MDTIQQATPAQNQTVSEFESYFRGAHLRPEIYGCTWQHFQACIAGQEFDHVTYMPSKIMFFGRMSASGFIDATDWSWDENLEDLIETMTELYLDI